MSPASDGSTSTPDFRLPTASIRHTSTEWGRANNTPKSLPKVATPSIGGKRSAPPKSVDEENGKLFTVPTCSP